MTDNGRIHLDTLVGCEQELERCTNGLAMFDHAFHLAVDKRDRAEDVWLDHEGIAAAEVATKGMTATELKGRIRAWVTEHPEAKKAREEYQAAERYLTKLDRYYRSLEKRASNAQTAQKRHLGEGSGRRTL